MVAFVPPSGNEKPLGPWTIIRESQVYSTQLITVNKNMS